MSDISNEQNNRKSKNERTIYFDYLRVFATISVMILHIAGQNWQVCNVNGGDWKVFNFYESIVRWGVPVFIMISGALFLNQEKISVKKIFTKYVFRLFVAYCFWSFVYYLFSGTSIKTQFIGLFSAGKIEKWVSIIKSHYHLWFVPMIAGIYICIPILKQIVKNENTTKYFLIISFIFWFLLPQLVSLINNMGSKKTIVIINALYNALNGTDLKIVMNYSFYFVLGYFISKKSFSKRGLLIIYILGILGWVFTYFVNLAFALKKQEPFGMYYGSSCINILAEAVAIFEIFKNISFKNERVNKCIFMLSKWSFGAYLVHALIIEKLNAYGINTLSFSTSAVSSLVIFIIVFFSSMGISAIINFIPILKKYIV